MPHERIGHVREQFHELLLARGLDAEHVDERDDVLRDDRYGDGLLAASLVSTTCVAFGAATCSETR